MERVRGESVRGGVVRVCEPCSCESKRSFRSVDRRGCPLIVSECVARDGNAGDDRVMNVPADRENVRREQTETEEKREKRTVAVSPLVYCAGAPRGR